MWHKQTAQHIILFIWDQRMFVSLSPEGDTYSNNVQTSFAESRTVGEREGKMSFKCFARKKLCNRKLMLFHFAPLSANVLM